jgi:hypothetical protein
MPECTRVRHQLIVKQVENITVYYKETVESRHLIFRPGSQGRVQCLTANMEPSQGVTTDHIPL